MMIELVVGDTELEQSDSGKILGPIFLRTDDGAFPDEGWSDFVVIVLGWWLEAIADLHAASRTAVDCRFMDGPYYFRLEQEARGKGGWRLSVFRHGVRRKCLGEYEIRLDEVSRDLKLAAANVLKECERQEWMDEDVRALKKAYSRFDQLYER